jgi:hypothetical protein
MVEVLEAKAAQTDSETYHWTLSHQTRIETALVVVVVVPGGGFGGFGGFAVVHEPTAVDLVVLVAVLVVLQEHDYAQ